MKKIKKVKIDDIARKAAPTNDSGAIKRPRGRPRKVNKLSDLQSDGSGNELHRSDDAGQASITRRTIERPEPAKKAEPEVVAVYDTTAESRAFLCAPFELVSGFTGCREFALYPEEIDALSPSFKMVYDKRIAPYMGENADIIAFSIAFTGIAVKKGVALKDFYEKKKQKERNDQSYGEAKIDEQKI